jgi:hypothetical protein
MGDCDQFHREGANVQARPLRDLDDPDPADGGVGQLIGRHRGGEGGGVDRATQAAPQVRQCAHMVLMGVAQDQAHQALPVALDEGRVRHHDVVVRELVPGEGDAEIDHEPGPGVAVEGQVHADLPDAPEGEEQDLIWTGDRVWAE